MSYFVSTKTVNIQSLINDLKSSIMRISTSNYQVAKTINKALFLEAVNTKNPELRNERFNSAGKYMTYMMDIENKVLPEFKMNIEVKPSHLVDRYEILINGIESEVYIYGSKLTGDRRTRLFKLNVLKYFIEENKMYISNPDLYTAISMFISNKREFNFC